jgi:transcriptional regulator with XRE-family HTH domain
VKGSELRRFREEQGWSQDELGKLLRTSLGKGSGTTVGKWEKEQRPVPDDVAVLVAQLQLDAAMPGEPPLDEDRFGLPGEEAAPVGFASPPVEGSAGDTAPPEPGESRALGGQLPLGASTTYTKVCTELWELVATGTGMIGAAIGSENLRRDGEIIHADSAALGRAWGKLAETNDTFRRILLASTTSGAWLELAMVTGLTGGKLYRSHQEIARRQAIERARAEAEWQEEHAGEVTDYGYQEPAAA